MVDKGKDKNFWVQWFDTGLHGPWQMSNPWWVSGYEPTEIGRRGTIYVAAVQAKSVDMAKEHIVLAHRFWRSMSIEDINWRFVEQKPDDWRPFSPRFPADEGMQWVDLVNITPEAKDEVFRDALDTKKLEFFDYHEPEMQGQTVQDLMEGLEIGQSMTVCGVVLSKPINCRKELDSEGREVIKVTGKVKNDAA